MIKPVKLDEIQKRLIREVADLHDVPEGAYNFRVNGESAGRASSANIEIEPKDNGTGLDIRIKPGTKRESVHIPVVMTQTGLTEVVYNDFYIGEGSDVTIVAGCGIDNCGQQDSEHDGIHRFFVGKGAKVRYVEKHYGSGTGSGSEAGLSFFKRYSSSAPVSFAPGTRPQATIPSPCSTAAPRA